MAKICSGDLLINRRRATKHLCLASLDPKPSNRLLAAQHAGRTLTDASRLLFALKPTTPIQLVVYLAKTEKLLTI